MPEHEVVDHGSRPWPSVVGRCVLEHGPYAQVTYVWNMVIVITNHCLVWSINVDRCEGGLFGKLNEKQINVMTNVSLVLQHRTELDFGNGLEVNLIWFDLIWLFGDENKFDSWGLTWSCQWLTGLLLLLQCYCSTSVKPALAFSFILTLAHWCSLIRSRRFHITH